MSRITFYPLDNADCTLIDLDGGQRLVFDYAHCRNADDPNDLRIDLAAALRADLGGRDYCDVVAFTHADDDHICSASAFFYLEHSATYQGRDRIKINELWVPAALIIETKLTGDARILQAEARHRLRKGAGIRVFSRPARLADWFRREGIPLESRAHLITDAGTVVPGFTTAVHGVEFFAHSPFAMRLDESTVVDRNDCSLVLQATMTCDGQETRVILPGDVTHDVLSDIVAVTQYHKRDERLAWDVFKVPHHCSYLSLSNEQGDTITTPDAPLRWLYETQAGAKAILISSSKPIPATDSDNQPPHRQAAAYYAQCAAAKAGQFVVTMEHPMRTRPERLVITVDRFGATVKKALVAGATLITSRPTPRAG